VAEGEEPTSNSLSADPDRIGSAERKYVEFAPAYGSPVSRHACLLVAAQHSILNDRGVVGCTPSVAPFILEDRAANRGNVPSAPVLCQFDRSPRPSTP
jgi:hypothetical protein